MINYTTANPLSAFFQGAQGVAATQDALNQVPYLKAIYANEPNVIAQQNLAANLKNQQMQDQVNVLPQLLANQVLAGQLGNQGTAISNQYIAPEDIAKINLMTQQGNFYPMMAQANLLGAQARMGYMQNMPTNALINIVKTPYGQALLNNNPQFAQAYNNAINQTIQRGGFTGFPLNTMQPMQTSVGVGMQPTNDVSGGGIVPPNIISSGGLGFTPQQIADAQQASSAELQRKTSDEATRAQALSAQEIYQTAQNINIKPLQYYSGIEGQAQLLKDKAAVVAGQAATPQLIAYNNFKQFEVPVMTDQIRKALSTSVMPGYVASMIKPLADPTNSIWDDPEMVASRWKIYTDWIKGYAEQRTAAVNKGIPSNISGQYSNPLEGSTQTGAGTSSNISIPSFSNQSQLQNWLKNASPSQRVAAKQKFGVG